MQLGVADCRAIRPGLTQAGLSKKTQLDYWDMGDLLKNGIPLVGLQPAQDGYTKHLVPASTTDEELMASAVWRRRALMCKHRDWTAEEQQALLEATSEEVKMDSL